MMKNSNSEKLKKREIHRYINEDLEKALFKIRTEEMTIREASRHFKVPKSTLSDRKRGRVPESNGS